MIKRQSKQPNLYSFRFLGTFLQKLLKDPAKRRSAQFMEFLIKEFQEGQTHFTTDQLWEYRLLSCQILYICSVLYSSLFFFGCIIDTVRPERKFCQCFDEFKKLQNHAKISCKNFQLYNFPELTYSFCFSW